jgi:hypothetical protein
LDKYGRISHEGQPLANLNREGELVANEPGFGRVVGRIRDGQIWEVSETGASATPIGRITGVVPGSGVRMHSGSTVMSPVVEVLRPQVSFEVLRIHEGWFEVRLASGQTGWVWAPFVTVSSFLFAGGREERQEGSDTTADTFAVSLTTGRNLWAQHTDRIDQAVDVRTADGQRVIMDGSLIRRIDRANHGMEWDWSTRAEKIEFRDGRAIAGRRQSIDGGAVIIHLETGQRIISDASLIALAESTEPSLR